MPEPSQPGAFRLSGRCDQPNTSAPRAMTLATIPSAGCDAGSTCSCRSTRSKYCDMLSADRSGSSRAHSSSTQSGVRQHVPVLIAVEPPTIRPAGIGITVLPIEPSWACA